MPTRSTPIGTFDSSSFCASAGYNEGPGGCIGYEELTIPTGGTITTENAIQVTTVPVNTGRLLKITAVGFMVATAPTGLQVKIIEDSTDLNRVNFFVNASGVNAAFSIVALSHSPSAGTHTYTLADGISGPGGATVNVEASATEICYIIVEDIGPDF